MRCGSLLPRLAIVLGVLTRHAAADECATNDGGTVRDQARAHYNAGLAAYQEQSYREAVDHLLCANRLVQSPAFAYNLAVTYEAMGDTATALRWYRQHQRDGGAEVETQELRNKVLALETQLQARGVQQVTVSTTPSGATLSIDDKPLGLTPFTTELSPGQHRYRVLLSGHAQAEGAFDLRSDRSLDVDITLVAAPPEPAPAPMLTAVGSAPAETRGSASVGPWTWASFGAGALLLGGAVAFELRRADRETELAQASQADYQDRYDAMQSQQTAARVCLGLGAAALVTGGVLLYFDLQREQATSVAVGQCARGGLCLDAGGVF